ncbi:MAG TPA: hypothetical protein VF752_10995 [Thermoleophilaceae bacterium]
MPAIRRRLVLIVLAACAALALVASTGFGRGDNHRAHITRSGAVFGKQVVSAASPAGFVYVRANGTLAPGTYGQIVLTCPHKFPHPVSGLFDTNNDFTLHATSRPDPDGVSARTAHKWAEGVTNTSQTQAGVTVGAVCMK